MIKTTSPMSGHSRRCVARMATPDQQIPSVVLPLTSSLLSGALPVARPQIVSSPTTPGSSSSPQETYECFPFAEADYNDDGTITYAGWSECDIALEQSVTVCPQNEHSNGKWFDDGSCVTAGPTVTPIISKTTTRACVHEGVYRAYVNNDVPEAEPPEQFGGSYAVRCADEG